MIKWGILATGEIASAFVQDLARVPNAEAVAVGSRSLAAAERFAVRHSVRRAYGSWTELAADPEVDVVYVATPHVAHQTAAGLCIAAGKAVLCEKPLTINAGEAERLVWQAQRRGVFLMEPCGCGPTPRSAEWPNSWQMVGSARFERSGPTSASPGRSNRAIACGT